ncbi:KRAB-A domain-containing protein 2-like [Rhopalosiphum padi]|uniref:KRAB-A domain-containing protein 2-like n=1 Tax=Rhopalosiphum padi TaxID=40932 RepID=UPI00298DEB9E|nr:KRAB-A domain-containing protein 2-like [Rhopalosiphum padi]
MAIDIQTVRTTFNEKLKNILTSKRDDNNSFLSTKDYNDVIEQVKKSKMCLKTVGEAKTMKDYRVVRKYDILKINGKERLIRSVDEKNVVLYYVKIDEVFDILHETHSAIGHGGRNRMMAELKNKNCNITNETVMVYLKLCVQCQKKAVHPRRGLVSKPILESTFNSRAQVDLIDMQSQHYNDYRFIMNYQDHLTKYVILKPLKSKRAEEIAYNLIDIYTLFGAPAILQSDNGREFVNSVINELHIMWNEVKIVHGKPRHSQSQGSVERANRDVQEMLAAWMGIGRTPYEAMFGCTARIGLMSSNLPNDEIKEVITEEDLEKITNEPITEEDEIGN